jgi:hypothetical protein
MLNRSNGDWLRRNIFRVALPQAASKPPKERSHTVIKARIGHRDNAWIQAFSCFLRQHYHQGPRTSCSAGQPVQ